MTRLFLLPLMLFAAPALAQERTDVTNHRSAPELSDIALFVMAAGGIWLARRALRRRFAAPADRETPAED